MTPSSVALEFEVQELPAETFAFVLRRVDPSDAGEFIGGAIDRVGRFAREHGGPAGPPLAIASAPDEEGALGIEAGWPVQPGTAAEAPIEVRTLSPTRAIVYRHEGPYEDLNSAFYAELFSQAHDAGFTPISGPRERYLQAPSPGRIPVVEVVWPIA
jgi:effector-binding domain-containing protein